MSTDPQTYRVLWTGGLDSSFRMVQLSRHDVRVQPYYVSDDRESERFELEAIRRITDDIKAHPGTACTLLPLVVVKSREIEPDREITEAYHRLRTKFPIGSQFEWIARLTKSVDGLELCAEGEPHARGTNCVKTLGRVRTVTDCPAPYAALDRESSDPDLLKVFGRLHFPLPLFEITKLQELQLYKEWGFGSTIDKTWFCHSPVRGRPCGFCKPCAAAIHAGLDFRFGRSALFRYRFRKVYAFAKKIKAVLRRHRAVATMAGLALLLAATACRSQPPADIPGEFTFHGTAVHPAAVRALYRSTTGLIDLAEFKTGFEARQWEDQFGWWVTEFDVDLATGRTPFFAYAAFAGPVEAGAEYYVLSITFNEGEPSDVDNIILLQKSGSRLGLLRIWVEGSDCNGGIHSERMEGDEFLYARDLTPMGLL
ncbi:MAG TPA: hypothetical protein ENO03_06600, partial [Candidatus Aminicenantes bacterium]|nr:hypothetical protein [Candidatus Aminicenantes bacterium]